MRRKRNNPNQIARTRPKPMITGSKVILRPRRLDDSHDDYSWETDPELAQLDAVTVTAPDFHRYLTGYIGELTSPQLNSQRFSIDTLDGKHIGNCAYYHINDTRGETELGIMIGNRTYWDNGYGTDAVSTLINHIFGRTKLDRIYLKTLASNKRAWACFRKCGFTVHGQINKDGFNFLLMEIHRRQWPKAPEETRQTPSSPAAGSSPPHSSGHKPPVP